MKIGFVLDDSLDKSDGVQQYVLTLGHWFHSQGHEVHYLVGQTERTDIPHIHSLSRNVQAHFNQNRMTTPLSASKQAIRDLLHRETYDVLHVQLPYSPLLAARVIHTARPETVVVGTFHIIPFSKLEALATAALGLVLRRNLKRFDAIYSVSEPARHFARRTFRVKSEVVPNAVNVSHFKSGKRIRKYADGKLNIVFLGRLVERKGCMHLLQALEVLHKQNRLERVRVLICGKGPLQSKLEAFVKKHHLGNIVHFVGYVDEAAKADYFASADIAVLPSTGGESFGIVLLEAMAAGSSVVIGGDNAGYRSVLGGRAKQLVNPSDTKEFAKLLHHFITSTRARQSAYKWQQEHIRQFDVRVVGGRLLKDYEYMIANRRKNKDNEINERT
jgi:phosphatidylinositol alpha-mannosyltransferase